MHRFLSRCRLSFPHVKQKSPLSLHFQFAKYLSTAAPKQYFVDSIENVTIVRSVQDAEKIVSIVKNLPSDTIHAWDTEAVDIDLDNQGPVGNGRIICASFYSGPHVDYGSGSRVWIDTLGPEGDAPLLALREILEDPTIKKVWHNYGFDRHMLHNHTIDCRGFAGDTMHMARLQNSARDKIDGGGGYSLEALSTALLGGNDAELVDAKVNMMELFGRHKMKKNGELSKVRELPPLEEVQQSEDLATRLKWIEYSTRDAEVTWLLYMKLRELLLCTNRSPWFPAPVCFSDVQFAPGKGGTPAAPGVASTYARNDPPPLMELYDRVIRPFGELLTDLERNGIMIDVPSIQQARIAATKDRENILTRFKDWAVRFTGHPDLVHMNVHSDTQKAQLLFGLPIPDPIEPSASAVKEKSRVGSAALSAKPTAAGGGAGAGASSVPGTKAAMGVRPIHTGAQFSSFFGADLSHQGDSNGVPVTTTNTTAAGGTRVPPKAIAKAATKALPPVVQVVGDAVNFGSMSSYPSTSNSDRIVIEPIDKPIDKPNSAPITSSAFGSPHPLLHSPLSPAVSTYSPPPGAFIPVFEPLGSTSVWGMDSSSATAGSLSVLAGEPNLRALDSDWEAGEITSTFDSDGSDLDWTEYLSSDRDTDDDLDFLASDAASSSTSGTTTPRAPTPSPMPSPPPQQQQSMAPRIVQYARPSVYDDPKSPWLRPFPSGYCPPRIAPAIVSSQPMFKRRFPMISPKTKPLSLEYTFERENVEGLIEEGKKKAKKKVNFVLPSLRLPTAEKTPKGRPSATATSLKKLLGKPLETGPAYQYFLANGCDAESALEACQRIQDLLALSAVDTVLETFLGPLEELGRKDPESRVHCSLNLNTETGRLSSRRPNLQNQPSLERDKYGIRKAFIAAPGKSFIIADYGQLELRVLAHITNCRSMIEAFEAGGDFHSRTAMAMYDYVQKAVESGEVLLEWDSSKGTAPKPLLKDKYAEERRKAKVLNFSIAYGKTAFGLAKDWGTSVAEAEETLRKWYADRPEVEKWQVETRKKARESYRVYTILGRHRDLPGFANKKLVGHMDRAAINTPIQGSAADIVICAMLKLAQDPDLNRMGYKLLLQIHDEVILEGPEEHAKEALQRVIDIMARPFDFPLLVDLVTDACICKSWGDA